MFRAAARATEVLQKARTGAACVVQTRSSGGCTSELSALDHLAAAYRQLLLLEDGAVDTRSETGRTSCGLFLDVLEAAAQRLRALVAPRDFRRGYSASFSVLFPGCARHYRVDVLAISNDTEATFHLNGQAFRFNDETRRGGRRLRAAWAELGELLQDWSKQGHSAQHSPAISDVRRMLAAYDAAWAHFERLCVMELMALEKCTRGLLMQAVEQESVLRQHEARPGAWSGQVRADFSKERRRLAECVAQLHGAVQSPGGGHADFGGDVLDRADAVLSASGAELAGKGPRVQAAARVLASRVVESFEALRMYLRGLGPCRTGGSLSLGKIPGLKERLAAWEASLEVGRAYLLRPHVLLGLCSLVAEVQAAQRCAPALAEACASWDAEAFVVLPRILWLCFLARPLVYGGLLSRQLPQHFATAASAPPGGPAPVGEAEPEMSAELKDLVQHFRLVEGQLSAALTAPPGAREAGQADPGQATWRLLLQWATVGTGVAEGTTAAGLPGEPRWAVGAFMRRLEGWSLELQRHCPRDWNQCCAVLLQCLAGGP